MKTLLRITFIVAFFFIVSYTYATDWDEFGKNLVRCLHTDNPGVQVSAMQQIITYADRFNVDDAVFDVVSIYRNKQDEKVRQLALSTLYRMQNAWAMDFLGREVEYEKSPALKTQIYHMLQDYEVGFAKLGDQKKDGLLAQKD